MMLNCPIVQSKKMAELSATRHEQFAEADRLEAAIKRNLEVLGDGE